MIFLSIIETRLKVKQYQTKAHTRSSERYKQIHVKLININNTCSTAGLLFLFHSLTFTCTFFNFILLWHSEVLFIYYSFLRHLILYNNIMLDILIYIIDIDIHARTEFIINRGCKWIQLPLCLPGRYQFLTRNIFSIGFRKCT